MQTNQGFTLTELMAVVIIIAIFAGVAAGSYKKAVERSHFNEGLQAAAAIMGGVERCKTLGTLSTSDCLKIKNTDISLSNTTACSTASDQCVHTKYFDVKTNATNNRVEAVRMKNGTTGDYAIYVYPSFGANAQAEKCHFYNAVGKDICISSGYGSGDCANASKTSGDCTK